MEIIERTIELDEYLKNQFSDNTFFFDIETLGLSPQNCPVYLIGVMDKKEGPVRIRLFFANSRRDEEELLLTFYEYTRDFDTLITFNGDTFDIPFVTKRSEDYGIPMDFSVLERIDLYKKFKKYKKLFNLERCSQKSFESFLGISREDQYDGGRLINVYYEYELSHDNYLKNLLILHNFEDVEGMASLNSLNAYLNIGKGEFTINSISLSLERINFIATLDTPVPKDLEVSSENYHVHVSHYSLTGSLSLKEDTMKLFHKNISDYVYVPAEDIIIPKALATTMPKNSIEKATRENCYTKLTSKFFLLPGDNKFKSYFNIDNKVIFRLYYSDKSKYLEIKESPDSSELSDLINSIIRYSFS